MWSFCLLVLLLQLRRKYHLTEKRRYHPDDFYEMMHVGSDYIQHVQKSDSVSSRWKGRQGPVDIMGWEGTSRR